MAGLDTKKIFLKDAVPTSIGGQAIMEGVMMQGPDRIALAMRLPDNRIYLKTEKKKDKKSKVSKIPFVRGIFAFVNSLVIGMSTLMDSADILEEYIPEEEQEKPSKLEEKINEKFGPKAAWNVMMFLAVAMALIITIVVFILFPTVAVNWLGKYISSSFVLNLIEGILRIIMFILYIVGISRMKEIKTLFQYHGAEHKTIHCFENGVELTPANAEKFYRVHPRCGTSFLVFVMIISLLLFSLLGWPSLFWRLTSRILLIPVVAGISFELLRWAGRSDNPIIRYLSYPGLMFQKITTADPTREQLEIAIISLKAVLVDPDVEDVDGFFKVEERHYEEVSESKGADNYAEDTVSAAEAELERLAPKKPAMRYSDAPGSVAQALRWGEESLSLIENGKNEAQMIFSYVTGMSRTDTITRKDEMLREDDFGEYKRRIEARLSGTPLQYITKVQEFMGLPFKVNPAVLIPRLDTEVLADQVIGVIKGFDMQAPDVLDLCTGSGALGVTIAHEIPGSKITMTDVSVDAMNVAIGNSQLNGVFPRCVFAIGDMFDAIPDSAVYDVIICNPPYIESDVIDTLSIEVKDHEPRLALDGGADGLDFYRVIAAEAGKHLTEQGILALEIGCDQGEAVKSLLEGAGDFTAITVVKDLNGLNRVVIAGRK